MIELNFGQVDLLGKALDASALRNEIISNNIANVDTVGFKRSDVKFEDFLKDALSSNKLEGYVTDKNHIPINPSTIDNIKPQIVQDNSTSSRLDGNNVDIDVEMSNLAKNQLYYEAIAQRINGELNSIITAVKDGR
ncbi:flagellar basal body rod protein FlgB [Thermoanaerobacterium sp. RBIITD]|uniref:flagellar basal body rod protein FlgB n=1 Tax=Thermoanaerobacterium sp. RBIITD TaxID=1550240 RepID=UPI000BB766C1|nr:flagellar basal body rod protein FlgB [Thermoanaerobacterium sp. RBIITD]SNX55526.1 flagellar basal-body rod protein FlgB [Thermoanaerobacterium sp. RBIITD]